MYLSFISNLLIKRLYFCLVKTFSFFFLKNDTRPYQIVFVSKENRVGVIIQVYKIDLGIGEEVTRVRMI